MTKKPSTLQATMKARADKQQTSQPRPTFDTQPEGEPQVKMTVNVPRQLHRRLKIEAVQKGVTIREIVVAAVAEALEADGDAAQ